MKTQFAIGILLLMCTILGAQSTTTFTQTIPLNSVLPVFVNLKQPFVIKHCDGDAIKIETNVTLLNGGKNTLQYLNHKEQYRLYLNRELNGLNLTDNTRRKLARINGNPLNEKVKHVIYVPEGFTIKTEADHALIADNK